MTAKRKRVETLPIRRGEPYFGDGNIILEAERTQFRVARGILAAASPTLKTMFSLPPTGNQVDGCPIIQLTDSAEDWKHLLKAMYKRSYSFVKTTPLPVAVVSAYLRLGTKYEITQFRTEAIERLSYEYPSSLEELNNADHYSRIQECQSVEQELFTVVELARKCNIPKILPWALYAICAEISFDKILAPAEPGQLRLSPSDQRICMLGWRMLVERQTEVTYVWLQSETDIYANCQTRGQCATARKDLLHDLLLPVPNCIALCPWDPEWANGLCGTCGATAKKSHNAGRRKIWKILPKFFELPEWHNL